MPKECKVCGEAFTGRRGKCCSNACSQILHAEFSEQIRNKSGDLYEDWTLKRRRGVIEWADEMKRSNKHN